VKHIFAIFEEICCTQSRSRWRDVESCGCILNLLTFYQTTWRHCSRLRLDLVWNLTLSRYMSTVADMELVFRKPNEIKETPKTWKILAALWIIVFV